MKFPTRHKRLGIYQAYILNYYSVFWILNLFILYTMIDITIAGNSFGKVLLLKFKVGFLNYIYILKIDL
jgi:hypothetical protein